MAGLIFVGCLGKARISISRCLANHFLRGSQSSGKLIETFYEPRLHICRRKRAQMRQVLDQCRAKPPGLAEKAARLVAGKAGETSCLIIGSDPIASFDQLSPLIRKLRREAEAKVDGSEKLGLEGPVVEGQRRLERTDQVADHIFRRVVNQGAEPEPAVELGLKF